jgi:hypothetical protein
MSSDLFDQNRSLMCVWRQLHSVRACKGVRVAACVRAHMRWDVSMLIAKRTRQTTKVSGRASRTTQGRTGVNRRCLAIASAWLRLLWLLERNRSKSSLLRLVPIETKYKACRPSACVCACVFSYTISPKRVRVESFTKRQCVRAHMCVCVLVALSKAGDSRD